MKNKSSYHLPRQNSQSVYGPSSELQQFMNDFDGKGEPGETPGNKPKMVLKDSSKYVKKKPSQKQQPSGNLSSSGTPVGATPVIVNSGL